MNPNEIMDINALNTQVDELTLRLEEAREERNALLRQRFDLKEQRRYFRAQLRTAKAEGNTDREEKLTARLSELAQEVDALDEKIDALENAIEETSDQVDEVMDQVEELEENAQSAQPETEAAQPETQPETPKVNPTVEKLSGLLTRGFQKMTDALADLDLEKMGEKAQSAATKAYKTMNNVVSDASHTLGNAIQEVKETREQPGGIGDCRISGSGTIDGGCYNCISTSGSCKVSSDLVCRELRTAGSFRALGSVDCNGPVRSTGSLSVGGDLLAGNLSTSGSTKVQGNVKSGPLSSTGGLTVGGDLRATALRTSGGLHVEGDVEADRFTTTGGLTVGGMVNADEVSIETSLSHCTVGSIGGSTVRVYQSAAGGLMKYLGASGGSLTCDSIEGDDVDLTAVKANVVRAANVVIRDGCEIDQVEYTESCAVEGTAKVNHCVQL